MGRQADSVVARQSNGEIWGLHIVHCKVNLTNCVEQRLLGLNPDMGLKLAHAMWGSFKNDG